METLALVLSIALASLNLQGNGYCLGGCQCHDNLVVLDVHVSLWLVKHKKTVVHTLVYVRFMLLAGFTWLGLDTRP